MTSQTPMDLSPTVRGSLRGTFCNRALTLALLASLWYVAVRFAGPWCGLLVTLVPIWYVRVATWRHALLVLTLFLHLVWQIVWWF
jgi:hypothetical protein